VADHQHVDAVTGTATTGHSWDDIKELNTPLPRWWVWLFYITIVWSVGYWVVYPAWPTITGFTAGVFGYSTRADVEAELAALQKLRGEKAIMLRDAPLDSIPSNQALLEFALAQGRAAFGDNCAPCHGTGGAGSKGYPNLNDDEWLWGGTLAAIQQTIEFGIRSGHDKTRLSLMPAFGRDKMLQREEIVAVANHVRSIAGLPVRAGINLDAGKALFVKNCAVCHGDDGKGKLDVGAPNLTDKVWLYGSDEATLVDVIANARNGVMPAWVGRLDAATIRALAVYVYSRSGGK
jgi:cytochrome c oxidase cbb3-type subunit 3